MKHPPSQCQLRALQQTKVAVQECTLAELRTNIQLKGRRINEVDQELTRVKSENTQLSRAVSSLNATSLRYQQKIAQQTEQVASLEGVLATY